MEDNGRMKQICDDRAWLGSEIQNKQDLWKTHLSAELIEDLAKEEHPDVAEIQKLVTVAGYIEDRLSGKYT